MPLTCWRSNITKICMIHTHWKPTFSSDSLYDEPFRVMSQFCEKCTKKTQNDLAMFKVKSTSPYTVKAQIFVLLLYDDPLRSCEPILWKVHHTTPKWPWHVQGQKYPYAYYTHTSKAQISLFSLYDELRPNIGKSAPNDASMTLTFSR